MRLDGYETVAWFVTIVFFVGVSSLLGGVAYIAYKLSQMFL